MKMLPWSMTLGRVGFAPLLLWLTFGRYSGWAIAACVIAEVALDVLDGMVARRIGVATPALRRADSLIDTLFFVAVLYCAWKLHFEALWQQRWLLGILLALEVFRYAFDYLKFHREAAYHLWSARLWGLVLAAAVIGLLAFGQSGWLLTAALVVGIVCDLEGIAVSFLLYESVEDVAHLGRAVELRRKQKVQREGRTFATTG